VHICAPRTDSRRRTARFVTLACGRSRRPRSGMLKTVNRLRRLTAYITNVRPPFQQPIAYTTFWRGGLVHGRRVSAAVCGV
jgi:hypothetical protein